MSIISDSLTAFTPLGCTNTAMGSQNQSRAAFESRTSQSAGLNASPRPMVSRLVTIAAMLIFAGSCAAAIIRVNNDATAAAHAAYFQPLLVVLMLNLALILLGWRWHTIFKTPCAMPDKGSARASTIAARDHATGLLTRRAFVEQCSALIAESRQRGKAVAILSLHFDQAKSDDDRQNEVAADATLRQAAEIIGAATPLSSLSSRLGGYDFACAMVFDAAYPSTVERVAEQLIASAAQGAAVAAPALSISIGIVQSDTAGDRVEAALHSASIAMRSARLAGTGRYAWFSEKMAYEINARAAREQMLRAAVLREEIVPYFEQQVDLKTGKLVGFEMLARWEHPGHGTIAPDEFIATAERIALIGDLSLSIMRQAFHAARDWHPSLTLSVNISPVQLKDPWLVQKIVTLLMETGISANRLEVEITEAALFANLALAQSVAAALKSHGIALALDDFGTGLSSLAHLRALPFDRFKVDRSFIMEIHRKVECAAIVQALIGLGENLQMPVTAEGIEDARIAEHLTRLGCARAQGHHYGRAMDAANTRRFLAERHLLTPTNHLALASDSQFPIRLAG